MKLFHGNFHENRKIHEFHEIHENFHENIFMKSSPEGIPRVPRSAQVPS